MMFWKLERLRKSEIILFEKEPVKEIEIWKNKKERQDFQGTMALWNSKMGVEGLGRIHNTGQRLALCIKNNISTFVMEVSEAVGADVPICLYCSDYGFVCVCVSGKGSGEDNKLRVKR